MFIRNVFTLLLFITLIFPNSHLNSQTGITPRDLKKGFIKNQGQIIDQYGNPNDSVLFLLNTKGLNIHLKQNGFSYDVYQPQKKINTQTSPKFLEPAFRKAISKNAENIYQRIDFTFLNTCRNLVIQEISPVSYCSNYYNVPGREEGIINVPSYKKVIYKNLYKGIDLEFVIPEDSTKPVEYNFIISPDGDISEIQFKLSGPEVSINDNSLSIDLISGTLQEMIPQSWIEKNSKKIEVTVNYKKLGENVYGFQLNQFLPMKGKLIIDPTPVRKWATYFGGDMAEGSYSSSMDYDSLGNTYYVGWTTSDNMATVGSFQTYNFIAESHLNPQTGILAKFDPSGNLVWSSYYGGKGPTEFLGVKVDSHDNIIGVGYTFSDTHIATTNALQTQIGGEHDGFVVKFDSEGRRAWGSYYGGVDQDVVKAVTVDKNDHIYLLGSTKSSDNILYGSNSFDTKKDGQEGFLARLDQNGNIQWSSYYGGEGEDSFTSIDIGPDSKLYALGYTNSSSEIATNGTYKPNITPNGPQTGDMIDSFVVKFSLEGNRIWGSYFGGDAIDWGLDLKVDNDSNIIIAGATQSNTEIGQTTSHQSEKGGDSADWDDFLAKFSSSGKLLWSTYYGGLERENYTSCAVETDKSNNIYLVGGTSSSNNISTPCSYKETFDGYENAFLAKFDEFGNRIWGTYYGKNQVIATDVKKFGEFIYIFGITSSNEGIASENSYQSQVKYEDNFIVKFSEGEDEVEVEAPKIVCQNQSLNLYASGGISYRWSGPNNFSSIEANPVIPEVTQDNTGIYEVSIETQSGCDQIRKFMIEVTEPPMAHEVPTLFACDDNNDGFSEYFDTSGIDATLLSGQTNMDITYYDEDGEELGNVLSNPFTNTIKNEQTLRARVTNTFSGCYAETFIKLKTTSAPMINTPDDLYSCNEENGYAYFDTSDIENQILNSQNGLKVFYYDENGNQLSSPIATNFRNTVPWQQEIFIRVEDENNKICQAETSFLLIVNQMPEINLEEKYYLCDLENFISLNANGDFDSWEWTQEDGTVISTENTVSLENAGFYTLKVTKYTNGIICQKSFDVELIRSTLPRIDYVTVNSLSNNNSLEIIASGDGEFEYSIDGIQFQNENVFLDLPGGTYIAEVRDKLGCGSDFKRVSIFDYPKFFTPNNDGYNDFWQLQGTEGLSPSKIRIFDRYGKLLKELSSQSRGWDGTFNGHPMPSDDYWFQTYLSNETNIKGHFSLIRE